MPNHVHVVLEPKSDFRKLMQWIKGRTGRKVNRILNRTGENFWQQESYDHWVRSGDELDALIDYVEENPVTAGFVEVAEQWNWSSASSGTDDKKRSSILPKQ